MTNTEKLGKFITKINHCIQEDKKNECIQVWGTKRKITRKLFAIICALILIMFQIIILGVCYNEYYDDDYLYPDQIKERNRNNEDRSKLELHAIDKITIGGSVMILVSAIIYWVVFYSSKNFGLKDHVTEAFMSYTALYTLGISIVTPIIKYVVVKNESYQEGMYPFYPIIFLSMLFGFYFYEIIKYGVEHLKISDIYKRIKKINEYIKTQ